MEKTIHIELRETSPPLAGELNEIPVFKKNTVKGVEKTIFFTMTSDPPAPPAPDLRIPYLLVLSGDEDRIISGRIFGEPIPYERFL